MIQLTLNDFLTLCFLLVSLGWCLACEQERHFDESVWKSKTKGGGK